MTAEERLEELESRLAFQDEAIRVLSDTIAAQDRQLLTVQRELNAIRDYLKELAHGLGNAQVAPASEETLPPHY